MSDTSPGSTPGFSHLIEKTVVMHANADWAATFRDVTAVMGEPAFSDGTGWATFGALALADESGPAWSLLAKTTDLTAVADAAAATGWTVGEPHTGPHETRCLLESPTGLRVVAYAPLAHG